MKHMNLLVGVLAMICLASCKTEKEEKEAAVKYLATSPLSMDTTYVKQYVAQIRSVRNIEIRAQEKGYLEAIYVDEGRFVKAGQLLFRIMPRIYQAELQKAEAEVRAAEIELDNTRTLVGKNIVSKNEQAMAQAKLDQARAEANLARLHLSFTEIRAPFDGILDRIPKKLGSLIDEGELLTTLSDNSEMFAYFNVSEAEYLDYQTHAQSRGNDKVNLLLANNTVLPQPGKVEVIEGEFDNETGNIAFRARFPNPARVLKNSETGKVLLTLPYKNALLIPQKATYELQDKMYVFVIDANHKVHSQLITVNGRLPDLYVVGSGLTAGEKILLEGVQKVKDDDTIEYSYQEPKEVLKHLQTKAE